MHRILVTGAAGFVGRALCRELIARGEKVRAAVRRPGNVPMGYELAMVGDIGAATDWSAALDGVNAIVHLAARVHVMHDTVADPLALFREVNVAGTERLARAAAAAGVRRFVYLSSVKVNGETTSERPFNEKDLPHPQDAYAISKWEAEQALTRIAAETGLEIVILRPPLVYGPGVAANFLSLLRWVERGVPLPLASLQNQRSLIYLDNLVGAIKACLEHPAAAGQTFMVSDGEAVSTPRLVRLLAQGLLRPPHLFPVPLFLLRLVAIMTGTSAQVDRLSGSLAVDNKKIHEMLGWVPPCSLEEGLVRTAAWFRESDVEKVV